MEESIDFWPGRPNGNRQDRQDRHLFVRETEFVHEGGKSRLCARRRLLNGEGVALSTLIPERCAGAALPGRALPDASSSRLAPASAAIIDRLSHSQVLSGALVLRTSSDADRMGCFLNMCTYLTSRW
jgi:hypothetical protein